MAESFMQSGRLRRWAETVFFAFVAAFFIRTFVVWPFSAESDSMENSVMRDEHVLIEKLSWHFKSLNQGDLVVVKYPAGRECIRRVAALPGQLVAVANKIVYVDNKPFDTPDAVYRDQNVYPITYISRDNMDPLRVPERKVFVLADNRDLSADSRFWGCIDAKLIQGRPWRVFWSIAHNPAEPELSIFNPISWVSWLWFEITTIGDRLRVKRIGAAVR